MSRSHARRDTSGALLYILIGLAGCAHVLHNAHDAGVTPPVATCSPDAPPPTPEVLRGESGGLVFADFTVQADGTISDLAPGTDDPHPDKKLFAATSAWLKTCKYKPALFQGGAIPVRTGKGVGFYQPYLIDHDGIAAIDWNETTARDLSAPQIEECYPQDPPLLDQLDDTRLSLVVQRDGHAGDTRIAEHLGEEDPGPYPLASLWLRTCHFTPAKSRDGTPVAVRIPLPLLFHDRGATPHRIERNAAARRSEKISRSPSRPATAILHPGLRAGKESRRVSDRSDRSYRCRIHRR